MSSRFISSDNCITITKTIISRPIIHSQSRQPPSRSPLAVKFSRSPLSYSPQFYTSMNKSSRPGLITDTTQIQEEQFGTKKSSAAQTDISALSSAHLWRSETNLGPNEYGTGLFTLPSKFTAPSTFGLGRYPLRYVERKFNLIFTFCSFFYILKKKLITKFLFSFILIIFAWIIKFTFFPFSFLY